MNPKISLYPMVLFILLLFACDTKEDIIQSLSSSNLLTCHSVGFGGTVDKQYQRFEKLKRMASLEELESLALHDSLVLATYASYALIDKKAKIPNQLMKRHLEQNTYVDTFCGCIGSRESVVSLIYDRYRDPLIEYPDLNNYDSINITDTAILRQADSLILYSATTDDQLITSTLKNRIYPPTFHPIIEHWAFHKQHPYATIYIFKHIQKGNEKRLLNTIDKLLQSKSSDLIYEQTFRDYRDHLIEKLREEG